MNENCSFTVMEVNASGGPHEHTLAGTFWNHVPNAQPVHVIAGAYRRGVEVAPSKLMADTSTRAVTLLLLLLLLLSSLLLCYCYYKTLLLLAVFFCC